MPHRALIALTAAFVGLAGPVHAIELLFPGPALTTARTQEARGSVALPVGAWADTDLPLLRAEGLIDRRAWRIDAPGQSTLDLLTPLRDQLDAAGFSVIFDCETEGCGGFDFRYSADLLPEPEMHVDLGDFRYLVAERGNEVLALMVSRSAVAGFAQLTRVSPAQGATPGLIAAGAAEPHRAPLSAEPGATAGGNALSLSSAGIAARDALIATLASQGRAVLEDLVFSSGEAVLAPGDYASLAALADWLGASSARQVALVGHTDASGGLETNIAISRRRADSVRAKLLERHGVDPAQVSAEGVGYLAPRAPNDSEAGRDANRRVEVVVTAGG